MTKTELSDIQICTQELYCFLVDCRLENPTEDDWSSIRNATKVFLDCWAEGMKFSTHVEDDTMEVCLDGKLVVQYKYLPGEHYDLQIHSVFSEEDEEDELCGDNYPLYL